MISSNMQRCEDSGRLYVAVAVGRRADVFWCFLRGIGTVICMQPRLPRDPPHGSLFVSLSLFISKI